MAKSVKNEFSRFIKSLEKAELEKELRMLFNKIPAVSQYYQMELNASSSKIIEEYKSRIRKEYFPSRGFGNARSSVSRKAVTDFKRIAVFQKDVIDLLLFRTEVMIDYTNAYGDIDAAFYNSLTSSFIEACKLINKENLEDEFRDRCLQLIEKCYGFGWGVYDELTTTYYHYIGDKE